MARQSVKAPEWAETTQVQDQESPNRITSGWESFRDNASQLIPIFIKAWDEDSKNDNVDLDIDWKAYFSLDSKRQLRTFIIRDAGKIIGFATFILVRDLLCDRMIAYSDTHYVLPEYRKSKLGLSIFREAKREFKKLKIDKLFFHEHDLSDRIHKIFKFMGAKKAQTMWEIDFNAISS